DSPVKSGGNQSEGRKRSAVRAIIRVAQSLLDGSQPNFWRSTIKAANIRAMPSTRQYARSCQKYAEAAKNTASVAAMILLAKMSTGFERRCPIEDNQGESSTQPAVASKIRRCARRWPM